MAPSLLRSLLRFLKDEDGPTAVEYCVMLMLILLAVITAVQLLGLGLKGNFQDSSDKLKKSLNG